MAFTSVDRALAVLTDLGAEGIMGRPVPALVSRFRSLDDVPLTFGAFKGTQAESSGATAATGSAIQEDSGGLNDNRNTA